MNSSPKKTVITMIADLTCPWCYIGRVRLDKAIARRNEETGATFAIEHAPFRLNPHFAPEGMNRRDYRLRKFGSWEESQRRDTAVEAAARAEGLDIEFTKIGRTPATTAAHCLISFASGGKAAVTSERLTRALYAAYFEAGQDIGDLDVLADIATAHGLPSDAALASITSRDCLKSIAESEQHWAALGVSGVPAFALPDGTLLPGADIQELERAMSRVLI